GPQGEQRLVAHQHQVVLRADPRQAAEVVQEGGQVSTQPATAGRRTEHLAATPGGGLAGLAQGHEVGRDAETRQVPPEQDRDVDAEGRMSFADEEQDSHTTSRWTGWLGTALAPR